MRRLDRSRLARNLAQAAAVVLLLVLVPLAAAAPPTAVDDSVSTAEDTTLDNVAVLSNDSDPEGDPLTIDSFGAAQNGVVAIGATANTLLYEPNDDFNGVDAFSYTAEDVTAEGGLGSAQVSVTVTPVNDPPAAVDDSYTVTSTGGALDVRANDSRGPPDEASQTLGVPTVVTQPANGTTALNSAGNIVYTPSRTFAGNDSFVYQVCDDGTTGSPPVADAKCDQATVSVKVMHRLDAGDVGVTEGDSGTAAVAVPVMLNAPSPVTVTIGFRTVNQTAFSGSDYQSVSGTLTFTPSDVVETILVNVVGDTVEELQETFVVELTDPSPLGQVAIEDLHGIVSIQDDDSSGCDITGTAGADQLTGTAGSETICGLGGNDRIAAGGGDDIVIGGPGNDTIDAGAGGDTVTAGAGNDRIAGGAGDDAIDGDAGNDTIAGDGGGDAIEGGCGTDTIRGGADSDSIDGGGGNDVGHGDAGDDIVDGHAGNDRLAGDAGDDRVDGGAGSDHVSGGAGNDWVNGGAGNETGGRAGIFGGAGNDTVRGEGGDNAFFPGGGDDLVQGGGRRDLVRYSSASSGVVVDLMRQRATGEGRDRLTGVEDVTGSRFADTLLGNSLANRLDGGAGNDRLFGRGGNDTLVGGAGRDALNGEAGSDSCSVGTGGGTTSSC